MPDILLKTEGIGKSYGSLVAVNNLSIEVFEGEVFGFLGPNGAGKTTSIKMMCGLLKPDHGRIWLAGKPLSTGNGTQKTQVGVCPQEIVLWERLTCFEQLSLVGKMYDLKPEAANRQAQKLLSDLDLEEKSQAQAHTLSGGMRRRLNLALALVHDPEILFLDEPEAGLDPQSRLLVREYIQSLARKKTVILTTHNMDEAERVAGRVAIIDHGELLVIDTPEALKRKVGHGDVLELNFINQADLQARVNEALTPISKSVEFHFVQDLLTLRGLNLVGLLPGILERLKAANLTFSDVRLRENTLEDVFIQLTGRRLRE